MNISTPEIDITPAIAYSAWGRKQHFNLTQLGNAERFAAQYSANIKYCHAWKKWLIWDGMRWTLDYKDSVVTLASKTVRSIYAEAKSMSNDEVKTTHEKHSRRSESAINLDAILKLARSRPNIPVTPDEFDRNVWLFNCANGTIDLRTGELRPHAKEDLMMKLASVEYQPGAQCPHWMAFLNRVLGEDQALIEFLQKGIGYSLTGSVTEKALFFLHGTGDNGKTTLVEAVRKIMGDYAGTVDIDAFMKKSGVPEKERAIAGLLGKRFVTSSEAAEGEALHEALLKRLTGMGRLSGRRIYGSAFEFDPQVKFFIDANHKPRISGTEEAIWNRFRMVPFTVSIPKEQQDKHLREKLAAEAPGILAWAVQGCLLWQQEGLGTPEAVTEATESYRDEMDPSSDFIADCCIENPGVLTPFAELYSACREWCHTYGEKVISQKALGLALDRHGFASVRTATARCRKGLALHTAIADTAYDA